MQGNPIRTFRERFCKFLAKPTENSCTVGPIVVTSFLRLTFYLWFTMIISLVVAVAEDNAIGKDNALPWRLPEDLKFFKRTTMGKPVIMGRKTYESLGKPLPGRLNIVLSGNAALELPDGVHHFATLHDAIACAKGTGAEEACIIGGGEIFRQSMQTADRIYFTRVHTIVPGADTFFPALDHTHWKRVWQEAHEPDEKHVVAYTFERYERIDL